MGVVQQESHAGKLHNIHRVRKKRGQSILFITLTNLDNRHSFVQGCFEYSNFEYEYEYEYEYKLYNTHK